MNNLGPTPTPRLEPLRPGDRERGSNDRQPAPRKLLGKGNKGSEVEPQVDFVNEENHQLDEQA